jgi:hypothetical protein
MKQVKFAFELVDDLLNTDWLNRVYSENVLEKQKEKETPYKDKEDFYYKNKNDLLKRYRREHS